MAESMLDKTGEQVTATAHKASRAASAVADALEGGVEAARRVAKQGGDAAEELLDDTIKRLQRHPIEAIVVTFAVGVMVGVGAGIGIGWSMNRR